MIPSGPSSTAILVLSQHGQSWDLVGVQSKGHAELWSLSKAGSEERCTRALIGVGSLLGANKVCYIIYLHNLVVISCLVNTVTLVIRSHRLIYCFLSALSSIPVFASLCSGICHKQCRVGGQGRGATSLRSELWYMLVWGRWH